MCIVTLILIPFSLFLVANAQKGAPNPRCTAVSEEAAFEILQKLHYIGDPKALIPEYDEEISQRCRQVKDLFTKGQKYSNCFKKSLEKQFFNDNLRNSNEYFLKQCKSEEWREKFLKFGRCLIRSGKAEQVHQCGYKMHDALKYALDRATLKDLKKYACCTPSDFNECIYNALAKDCGKETAELAYEVIYWGPAKATFVKMCPGDNSFSYCSKVLPSLMKQMEHLFQSTRTLTPRNFPKVLVQIMKKLQAPQFSPRPRN